MLERFRLNLPNTPAVRADSRTCPFVDGVFDAAVSWGMLFHLEPRDQAAAFSAVSRVLKPGAPFLFTAAEIPDVRPDDLGITGTMNGVTFRYYAVADYRTLIGEHGFELENVYDDPGVSTYYFSRKRRPLSPDRYLGPVPVIAISLEICAVGSATIFVAETLMPFRRSLTVAGLPSEVNVNESGTVYSRVVPFSSERTT